MGLRIERDSTRFKNIVRGKIRQSLKKYVTNDNLIGQKGKDKISIPINHIDVPRFKYGKNQGGVGQGNGKEGDIIGQGNQQNGNGQAGDQAGDHILEVEMSVDELTDLIAEELELPNIEEKGKKIASTSSKKYNGIQRVGNEGLRHFKRTFKEALKREISSGTYVPGKAVIPQKTDKRYRTQTITTELSADAVVIYMMDVSGSMGDEQKQIVRTIGFWMNSWLKKQYKGIETRYIIHDVDAKEVSEDAFFTTRESGGTRISSAYEECLRIIKENYPVSDWNIYAFHFSDGDNWSTQDSEYSVQLVKDELLPKCNLFGYGQTESTYGSGQFIRDLDALVENDKIVMTMIPDRDSILSAIRAFLGKGK